MHGWLSFGVLGACVASAMIGAAWGTLVEGWHGASRLTANESTALLLAVGVAGGLVWGVLWLTLNVL